MNYIEWFSNDYCPKCKSHSLVLIDSYNNKIPMDKYDENSNRLLLRIHCNNCNTNYDIHWKNRRPYPLLDKTSLNNFLQQW